MKTLTLLLLSTLTMTANAAMSEYEIEMIKLEKERTTIAREALENQKLTGLVTRCHIYKQYLGTVFQQPEDCTIMQSKNVKGINSGNSTNQCKIMNPSNGMCMD